MKMPPPNERMHPFHAELKIIADRAREAVPATGLLTPAQVTEKLRLLAEDQAKLAEWMSDLAAWLGVS